MAVSFFSFYHIKNIKTMTFFGLTALGPQNVFSVTSTTYRYLQVFEEEDFTEAWVKVNKQSKQSKKSNLGAVFTALFNGPVPIKDKAFLDNAFDEIFETPETISYESFIKIMLLLRDGQQHYSIYLAQHYFSPVISKGQEMMIKNMRGSRSQTANISPAASFTFPLKRTPP